jgi:hypothetical protein
MPCTARKADTVICGRIIPDNQTLCGTHEGVKQRAGPNKFALDQLKLRHKSERKVEDERLQPLLARLRLLPANDPVRATMFDQYLTESGAFTRRQSNERTALIRQQRAEIERNGGVNPDQAGENHRATRRIIREWDGFRRRILRWPDVNWDAHINGYRQRITVLIDGNQLGPVNNEALADHLLFIAQDYRQILEGIRVDRAAAPPAGGHAAAIQGRAAAIHAAGVAARAEAEARAAANPNENMGAFARDRQNVHTTAAVAQVKHNINVIRQIFVPPEYRWDPKKISKTYREIVFDCDLSPKGNWQFASYYCNNAQIYDLEEGIFGIMTDGVWQYIRDSEDKRCLINILKRELEDNIGMCAQGNLSRICNVLSGYLPGIGQSESISTILGREFPKLMDIEREPDRLRQGERILRENNVPEAEWEVWLDPLRA